VKARSIRVDVVLAIRVGSVTICDKLKDDITFVSLLYDGVVGDKKFTLKSPMIQKLVKTDGLKVQKVENKVSNNKKFELGGL
jgi:hypothetical protein